MQRHAETMRRKILHAGWGKRIGIKASGNAVHGYDQKRSITITQNLQADWRAIKELPTTIKARDFSPPWPTTSLGAIASHNRLLSLRLDTLAWLQVTCSSPVALFEHGI